MLFTTLLRYFGDYYVYDKETLEYEDMVSVLWSNGQREKLTKEGVLHEGLVVRERSERGRKRSKQKGWSKSKEKSKGRKDTRCYKCHEIGHFKRDYPQLRIRKGESSGSDSVSDIADVLAVDDLLVVSDDHQLHPDVWALDSACSYHYTPN